MKQPFQTKETRDQTRRTHLYYIQIIFNFYIPPPVPPINTSSVNYKIKYRLCMHKLCLRICKIDT